MIIFLGGVNIETLSQVLEDINENEGTSYELDNDLLNRFRDYAMGNKVISVHAFYTRYSRYFVAFQGIDSFLRKSRINFNKELENNG